MICWSNVWNIAALLLIILMAVHYKIKLKQSKMRSIMYGVMFMASLFMIAEIYICFGSLRGIEEIYSQIYYTAGLIVYGISAFFLMRYARSMGFGKEKYVLNQNLENQRCPICGKMYRYNTRGEKLLKMGRIDRRGKLKVPLSKMFKEGHILYHAHDHTHKKRGR